MYYVYSSYCFVFSYLIRVQTASKIPVQFSPTVRCSKHDIDAGHSVPSDCTRQAAMNRSFNRCGRWVASPPHLSAVDPAFRSLWGLGTRQLILILHHLCLQERWVCFIATVVLSHNWGTAFWRIFQRGHVRRWLRCARMCLYLYIFRTLRILLNTFSCYLFNYVIYGPCQLLRSVLDEWYGAS